MRACIGMLLAGEMYKQHRYPVQTADIIAIMEYLWSYAPSTINDGKIYFIDDDGYLTNDDHDGGEDERDEEGDEGEEEEGEVREDQQHREVGEGWQQGHEEEDEYKEESYYMERIGKLGEILPLGNFTKLISGKCL